MDDSEIDKYVMISIMTILVLILVFLILNTVYYSRVSQTPNKDLPRDYAYGLMIVSIIFIIITFGAICVCIWQLIRKTTVIPVKTVEIKPAVSASPVITAAAPVVNKPVVLTEAQQLRGGNNNNIGDNVNENNFNSNDISHKQIGF